MEYKVFDKTVFLRLDKNDEITECLLSVAKKEKITLASVTGIGATDDLLVGVFDSSKRKYDEFHYTGDMEINNLVGNITVKDFAPYVHLHITATNGSGQLVGGHLLRGKISLTAEIFITVTNASVSRKFDSAISINRLDFQSV